MAFRICNLGRRIISLKGILSSDVTFSSSRCVHSFTLKSSSNSSSNPAFVPSFLVDTKDIAPLNNETNLIKVSQVSSPRLQILDRPVPVHNKIITDLPFTKTNINYEDKLPEKEIEDPKPNSQVEKHAIRMIVIRKRKMRVHKLKKWRKKMKFVIAKVRLRRKMEKEKKFQAELLAKIKEAEQFDPAVYVKEKIKRADEELIPKLWRGKRLPEFVIKELIDRKKKKNESKLSRLERRKNMNVCSSDYK